MLRQMTHQALVRLCSRFPIYSQSERGTCVFRRMNPPRPRKEGIPMFYKGQEYLYILEENTVNKKLGNMDVLLVDDVEGVGIKGELVNVSKRQGRNHLLPSGQAVYASPQNVEKYAAFRLAPEEKKISYVKKTVSQLSRMNLNIPMSPKYMWTLEKSHVKVAFRQAGVQLETENIELPEEPITEPTDLVLTVTVNGKFKVPVRATVYFYYADEHLAPGGVLPQIPKVWNCHSPSDVQTVENES